MLWHGEYIRHKTAEKGPEIGVGGGAGWAGQKPKYNVECRMHNA